MIERRPMADYFEKIWKDALGAAQTAEDEVHKVVHRVSEMAGHSQEEVKRQVREFTDRLAAQRKDLEKSVEEGVRRAISKVRLPRREELTDLSARLDRVQERVDALSKES